MSQPSTKKWYQSKIVLLGLAALLLFGGAMLYRYLINQGITQTQLDVLQQQYPDIKQAVEQIQSGQDIWQAVGALFGALVVIVRTFFTNKLLPQSLK